MSNKEVNIWREIVHRFRFKYRVSVLNENTLEEAWHIRLSRMSLFVWSGILFVAVFAIMAVLIIYTPVRNYLPGVINADAVFEVRRQTQRIDSLTEQLAMQAVYVDVLRAIVSGELPVDSINNVDSIDVAALHATLSAPTTRELAFRTQYEDDERYSVTGEMGVIDSEKLIFFRPADGVSEQDTENPNAVVIVTPEGTPVMSVLDGVVIDAYYDIQRQWTVVIEHADNYISVCRGLNKPLTAVGNEVAAGEAIATVGRQARILFLLWHNRKPVDASQVL